MRGKGKRQRAFSVRRGIAAAIVLLAVLLQFMAPHLPMPAMGGLTSVQLAFMSICRTSGHEDGDTQKHHSNHESCPICVVVAQAGTTLAPATIVVPTVEFATYVEHPASADAPRLSASASVFSSRAPPQTA
jgi:hypothetical protein